MTEAAGNRIFRHQQWANSLALFLIVSPKALADGHVRSRLSVVQFRRRTLLMDKKSQELDWGLDGRGATEQRGLLISDP